MSRIPTLPMQSDVLWRRGLAEVISYKSLLLFPDPRQISEDANDYRKTWIGSSVCDEIQ